MKTQLFKTIRALSLALLSLALTANAVTNVVSFSALPSSTVISNADGLALYWWSNNTYIVKRIAWSNLLANFPAGSITNFSGTNIISGTINSNKLDAATLALLGAGGGGSITNFSGTNIISGTINSNKLDAATLALLGAGGGGSGSNIAGSIWITNMTFFTNASYVQSWGDFALINGIMHL